MLRNYFKNAYRQLVRHKFFSILNIAGLAMGFGCSLLLILFIWNESGYDNFHSNADRIVRVTMGYKVEDQLTETAVTGSKVAPTFARELPEVESAIRFSNHPVVVKYDEKLFDEDQFLYADSTFFDIFSFHLLKGNPQKALNGKNKVVITPATARRYFGSEDPIGQTLLINNSNEFEVTGIIEEAPENSQIKYDFIGTFSSLRAFDNEEWWTANYYTYLLLHSPQDITSLQSKIFDYMKSKSGETNMTEGSYLTYNFEPLTSVHLHSSLSGLEPNIDIRYIYIFGAVTLLILLIACINYMNLATARATDRGTEVGIRKVLGAHQRQLFWQYISESLINVFLAACLAWLIASIALPYFNKAVGRDYVLEKFATVPAIACFIAALLIVSFLAGAYPAIILSHFAPAKTLKGKFKSTSGGVNIRKALIIFQFVISAVLIICSLVIYQQLDFIRNTNLGYQKEQVFSQSLNQHVVDEFETLKGLFMQYPQVKDMTLGYDNPTHLEWGDGIVMPNGKELSVTASPVEKNYLKTFNIRLLAGKDFSQRDQVQANADSASVLNQASRTVIINEKAAELMGWTPEEAIGKRISFHGNAEIIGVMDNFHFAPLHEEIGPLAFFVDNIYNQLLVKLSGSELKSTLSNLKADWKRLVPSIPFNPSFLDQEYNSMYHNEQRMGRLFGFFTSLAILLGCMGLLGLSALMISHRTKEIGIRKVLGATVGTIVRELSIDFIKMVFVAFIIAAPVAWFIMHKWLETFVYRINMPWMMYIISGFAILCLALVVLSTQTIRAATRNPVDVMRNE